MTKTDDRPRLVVEISAGTEEIDLVDRLAAAWLGAAGLSGEDRDHFVLAVREAVANAVCHGSALDPDKSVEILFTRGNNLARVRVVDHGEGFDPAAVPDPLAPENLLKPTGRGILLMKSYSDGIEYEFSGGTAVELQKRLPPPADDEAE